MKISKAEYNIGAWLSAALEDPNTCPEMKADIRAWFDSVYRSNEPDYLEFVRVVAGEEWLQYRGDGQFECKFCNCLLERSDNCVAKHPDGFPHCWWVKAKAILAELGNCKEVE